MALLDPLVDRLTRPATVTGLEELGAFRLLRLRTGDAPWAPGAKVQVRIHGATFRTYTPFDWDADSASLLVHRAGTGPATGFFDDLAVGDDLRLFGPRRSLVLTELDHPPVLGGDETSFALAAAWARHGSGPAVAHVFEVSDVAEAERALAALGVADAVLVARRADDVHHPDLAARTVEALQANPGAPLVLTGKAQSIRAVRGAVRSAGLTPTARVKAYWDERRAGLD